jgi:hypothetical protein
MESVLSAVDKPTVFRTSPHPAGNCIVAPVNRRRRGSYEWRAPHSFTIWWVVGRNDSVALAGRSTYHFYSALIVVADATAAAALAPPSSLLPGPRPGH